MERSKQRQVAAAFAAMPAPAADKFVMQAAEGGMAEVQMAQLSQGVRGLEARTGDHPRPSRTREGAST